jgi:hypothetical protein
MKRLLWQLTHAFVFSLPVNTKLLYREMSRSELYFMGEMTMFGGNARGLLMGMFMASATGSSAFAKGADNTVADQIDPRLNAWEHATIAQVMSNLDPEDRENVIYVDENGSIFTNKPELKQGVVLTPASEVVAAERFAGGMSVSQELAAPSCTSTTGPYRRVYSNASYSWLSTYVHLPGTTAEIKEYSVNGSGDTAYVYSGGWGANGDVVDAGFQHSPTYDNWSAIITVNGSPLSYTPRFLSNQDVNLKFYVPSNGQVALSVTGYDVSGTKTTLTQVRAAAGFSSSGGNTLKRVTSIGQSVQGMYTGSYVKNVHWYSSYIGTSSTSNHVWLAADTGGYCSYPDSTKVQVNYVNAGEETDNIILN